MAGPLTGIIVLDLSRVVAGPWCTQILADMGAEVIKVERPGAGDETRRWGPPWLKDKDGNETDVSAYFLSVNRGKRSVTINLADAGGQALVRGLAEHADILIENFKVGDLASKGLGYDSIARSNPGLIYCSITGFGQTGPMAELPGYDYLIQGQGGLMSVTGLPDGAPGGGPQRVGVAIADLTTGMNAAIAILGALHHRQRTGEGQYIDMSLLDVQVSWLANQAQNYLCSGDVPARTGDAHPNLAPYQPFATRDGRVIVAVGNDSQFARLCDALGLNTLPADTRFATNSKRVKNRDALAELLENATKTTTSDELILLLRAAGVPCGLIQSVDEVFDDPQVQARQMLVDVGHPELGNVKTVASPIRYSKTEIEYDHAPPALGADTERVLGDVLGLDDARIAELKARGAI